jgi:hypothetical protein
MRQEGRDAILPDKGNILPDLKDLIWGVYPIVFALVNALNLSA